MNTIKRNKLPKKSLYTLFLLYSLVIPVIAVYLRDYDGTIARWCLGLFFLPIGLVLLEVAVKLKISLDNDIPRSLTFFFLLLLFGFIIRVPTAREFLNIISYIVPYLGLIIFVRHLQSEQDLRRMLESIINFFLVLFFVMIVYTTIITFFEMSNLMAPRYYLWQSDGFGRPLRLMTYHGHHTTAYMAGFVCIFSLYRFVTSVDTNRRIKRFSYGLLFVLTSLMLLLSSARIALILILVIIPLALISISTKLFRPKFITLTSVALVFVLYLSVTKSDLMLVIIGLAENIQNIIHLRVINPQYLTLFSGRENLWATLLQMVSEKPFWGHGYPLPYPEYGITMIREASDTRVGGSIFHGISESGLLLGAKYGLPVFASFVFFFIKPSLRIWRHDIALLANMVCSYALVIFLINGAFVVSFDMTLMIIFLIILFHKYLMMEIRKQTLGFS